MAMMIQVIPINSVLVISLGGVYYFSREYIKLVLREMTGVLGSSRGCHIMGDFNYKSFLGGGDKLDSRGYLIKDWIAPHNFNVAYEPDHRPTFNNIRGRSLVDLTLLRTSCPERYNDWRIWDTHNLSDDYFITLNIRVAVSKGCPKASKKIK